jgi:nucleotide-binding universal stress UspA family protein
MIPNDTQVPAGTIVVGVDGSPSSVSAVRWAVEQAVADHRPLTLAHATREPGEVLTEAHAVGARPAPTLEVHGVTSQLAPRDMLLALSDAAATVVVGSRGLGPVRSLLLGSVGVALVRHAGCPVVVHRPANHGVVRQGVVVGVDGTPDSHPVLEEAYHQAALRDLPLLVLHCVWDAPAAIAGPHLVVATADLESERLLVAETVAGFGEKYPEVRARTELARGTADGALVAASSRMNLVVVGAHHGRTGSVPFGSVAASVVEHAHATVEVVPIV